MTYIKIVKKYDLSDFQHGMFVLRVLLLCHVLLDGISETVDLFEFSHIIISVVCKDWSEKI